MFPDSSVVVPVKQMLLIKTGQGWRQWSNQGAITLGSALWCLAVGDVGDVGDVGFSPDRAAYWLDPSRAFTV